MFGFLVGAIAGGIAVYYWNDRIRDYMDRVPDMRERAAERLGEFGERAGTALDRARSKVETGVRAGQQRLRSTGTATGTDGPDVGGGTPYTGPSGTGTPYPPTP
jgi:hypothetical protein